jgi:DnaJ-class molecular chaperone
MMDVRSAFCELGVASGSPPEAVRAAYKALALRLHPDKSQGEVDAFRRVHEAYRIAYAHAQVGRSLNGSRARSGSPPAPAHTRTPHTGQHQTASSNSFSDMARMFVGIIATRLSGIRWSSTRGRRPAHRTTSYSSDSGSDSTPEDSSDSRSGSDASFDGGGAPAGAVPVSTDPPGVPPPPISVDLCVPLEEVWQARVKKIVIWARRRAPLLGSTMSLRIWERQTLLVSLVDLRRLSADGCSGELRMEGMGDDPPFWGPRGDVVVRWSMPPHPVYRPDDTLSPFDLHAEITIGPVDFYYGRTFALPILGTAGPQWSVTHHGAQGRSVHVERGAGLPVASSAHADRGDLYVFFQLHMPKMSQAHLDRADVRAAFDLLFATDISAGGDT